MTSPRAAWILPRRRRAGDAQPQIFSRSRCNSRGVSGEYQGVGDQSADFEELFRTNFEPVTRFVARRLSPDDVQDVVSETFIVAWRNRSELKGDPLPWLLGVARRVCSRQLRGHARRGALHARLRSQTREGVAEAQEHESPLALALRTLPERDREALMLIAWDGLEHRVAASVMGCSTTAFTVRVHRARRKLERALEQSHQQPMIPSGQARSTS
jgi:RNA polymerase sigma-70 factor (ECF subfamily)